MNTLPKSVSSPSTIATKPTPKKAARPSKRDDDSDSMVAEPQHVNIQGKATHQTESKKSESTKIRQELSKNRMNGPTIAELAPIELKAENDPNPPSEGYWVVVTWAPQQMVKMHNPTSKQEANVGMTAYKIRRTFHRDDKEDAEKFTEEIREREKYFYHMLVSCGDWTCLMTDEKAAEKVGIKFAYNKDQPVLKAVMEGYYKSIDQDRSELAEHVHEANSTTQMWKKLSKMNHDPSLLNAELSSDTEYKKYPGKLPELTDEEKEQEKEEELRDKMARLQKFAASKKPHLQLKPKVEQQQHNATSIATDLNNLTEMFGGGTTTNKQ